jgi:hypothetical protein
VLQPAKRTPPNISRSKNSNTQRTENKTTDVVIQQHSRKLLVMDILISETCWAHNKWNKIASDIKLVFHSSTIAMMHGPINIRLVSQYSLLSSRVLTVHWKREVFRSKPYFLVRLHPTFELPRFLIVSQLDCGWQDQFAANHLICSLGNFPVPSWMIL